MHARRLQRRAIVLVLILVIVLVAAENENDYENEKDWIYPETAGHVICALELPGGAAAFSLTKKT